MVPAIQAADAMCKTAEVVLVSYENMSSRLVTVMVTGDVAAVRVAVEQDIQQSHFSTMTKFYWI